MSQKRKVRRITAAGKHGAISTYNVDRPLMMPTWLREFIVQNLGYFAAGLTVIMAFLAVFAAVLLFNALPLGFLGRPAVENGAGWSAALILVQFVLLALSIKPLFSKLASGWNYVLAATLARGIYHVVQSEYIAAISVVIVSLYVLLQIRHYYIN